MTAGSVVGPVARPLVGPVPGRAPRPLPGVRGVPRSPAAAVDQLCHQMRAMCVSAVDPLEIAAALEAEAGLTGPILRARYGCPDVFVLAEQMYRRTVRSPAEPPAQPDPWVTDLPTHVGHAVLYGLPAASYAVAAPLLSGTAAMVAVLVSLVTSWTLAQALAYLGYARMSRLDPRGAAQVLLAGMLVGAVVVGAALGAAAVLAPADPSVLLFAGAQGGYLLAATVLLVLKAERWVFAALAPGALAGAACLLAGRPAWADGLLWLPLAVSALVAGVAAVVLTRGRTPGLPVLGATDRRGGFAQAQFGFCAAGLLAFPVAVVGFGAGPGVSAAAALTLPLSLSMGAAEWSLYGYRRDVQALLERCRTPRDFTPRARRAVLVAVLRYLAVAALLVAVTAAVLPGSVGDGPLRTALVCCSYLALGGALFVALLLQALGGGAGTGLACGGALALEGLLVLGPAPLDVTTAQLVACAALFTGLVLVAGTVLGRVGSHI